MWQHQMELEEAAAEEGGVTTLQQPLLKVSEFPAAELLQCLQAALQVRVGAHVCLSAH